MLLANVKKKKHKKWLKVVYVELLLLKKTGLKEWIWEFAVFFWQTSHSRLVGGGNARLVWMPTTNSNKKKKKTNNYDAHHCPILHLNVRKPLKVIFDFCSSLLKKEAKTPTAVPIGTKKPFVNNREGPFLQWHRHRSKALTSNNSRGWWVNATGKWKWCLLGGAA